jgi:hypothetical protein
MTIYPGIGCAPGVVVSTKLKSQNGTSEELMIDAHDFVKSDHLLFSPLLSFLVGRQLYIDALFILFYHIFISSTSSSAKRHPG